ncbi:nucleotide exchange factor GrpE [Jonquetella anthropi]|uniref:nucleotide exchange factor GrpE n=1 Tax=Jonquetella anthropi TaxID=428712 RepID=UPI0023F3FD2D|nr:nucleotide exchange factor GrpE [Jonquetella anthropi]
MDEEKKQAGGTPQEEASQEGAGGTDAQEASAQAGGGEPKAPDFSEELTRLQAERDQFRELAARAQADGINYRNWAEKEFKRLKAQGSERAVTALLPVLDNLERALEAGGDGQGICQGVRMVRDQFLSALETLGVTVIDPTGQEFSPLLHHAVALVETDDPAQDGQVIDVFRKGYSMNGTAIRPAQVRVGRLKEPPAPAPEAGAQE